MPPDAAPANDTQPADPGVTGDEKDPQAALNGAQVTSLLSIVNSAATRQVPRETAIQLIVAAFPISPEQADRILGPVGKSFFVEEPDATSKAPAP